MQETWYEKYRQEIKTIAVLRALQLGDILCSIPALRSLRSAFPTAHISFIGLSESKPLIERFSDYVDEFIVFPGYPGLKEQPFDAIEVGRFLAVMQKKGIDLAIQMQGNGTITNSLAALFGTSYTVGFFIGDNYRPEKETFFPYPASLHEVKKWLWLLEQLGIPCAGLATEFPLLQADKAAYQSLCREVFLDSDYVCIHPGSRDTKRRWPASYFAEVADTLADKGYQIVLTGTQDEYDLILSVKQQMNSKAVDVSGRTSLGTLAMLLKYSSLLISNDTGVAHLAYALSVPSITLFIASSPEEWGPLQKKNHIVLTSSASPASVLSAASFLEGGHYRQEQNILSI
jgi:ADP-heptose:LPS heptosyltransferase